MAHDGFVCTTAAESCGADWSACVLAGGSRAPL